LTDSGEESIISPNPSDRRDPKCNFRSDMIENMITRPE
jgi:hypothetical protein